MHEFFQKNSGSCEALRFKLVDMATVESSNAVDEIEIFLSVGADFDFDGALRFFDVVGEIICR